MSQTKPLPLARALTQPQVLVAQEVAQELELELHQELQLNQEQQLPLLQYHSTAHESVRLSRTHTVCAATAIDTTLHHPPHRPQSMRKPLLCVAASALATTVSS